MITDALYNRVLIEPLRTDPDLDRLCIVSGYATAAMGFHHLTELSGHRVTPKVELICGMTLLDGQSISNHLGFKKLATEDFPDAFSCSYINQGLPVHSKVYVWCRGDTPKYAFLGSANYTQAALRLARRREVMEPCDAVEAFKYFNTVIEDTVDCMCNDVETEIVLYRDKPRPTPIAGIVSVAPTVIGVSEYDSLPTVEISLLDRSNKLPARSGLNWGQRPEHNRDPNQAYIRVPVDIARSHFFPPRGTHFTVLGDDGRVLTCTVAQDGDKAIETPHNNSLIGKYFRDRLGLRSGALVTADDLLRHGRTKIKFFKIDEENYYMDFSHPVR